MIASSVGTTADIVFCRTSAPWVGFRDQGLRFVGKVCSGGVQHLGFGVEGSGLEV